MAQTLTRLLVHIVFSTKDRADLITPKMKQKCFVRHDDPVGVEECGGATSGYSR